MANDKQRPILISVIAILYFIAGIFAVIAGIALMLGVITQADMGQGFEDMSMTVLGAALLIYGLFNLVMAGGFWNGWTIMWILGVIFTALGLIIGIASIFFGGFIGIIPIIIYLLILWYLLRPGVKEFFGM